MFERMELWGAGKAIKIVCKECKKDSFIKHDVRKMPETINCPKCGVEIVCKACGKCCKDGNDVTFSEVVKILDCLDEPIHEWNEYFSLDGFRLKTNLKSNSSDCIFLTESGLCRVHEVKPRLCKVHQCQVQILHDFVVAGNEKEMQLLGFIIHETKAKITEKYLGMEQFKDRPGIWAKFQNDEEFKKAKDKAEIKETIRIGV